MISQIQLSQFVNSFCKAYKFPNPLGNSLNNSRFLAIIFQPPLLEGHNQEVKKRRFSPSFILKERNKNCPLRLEPKDRWRHQKTYPNYDVTLKIIYSQFF